MISENLTTFVGLPVVDFDPASHARPDPDPDPAVDRVRAAPHGLWRRGPHVPHPGAVAWRLSAWHDADFKDQLSPAFRALFEEFVDSPLAPVTTALVLGAWGYPAIERNPIEQVVAAAPRLPALRALFYGDITSERCEISWIKQADVTRILAAYPDLEVFRVRGADGLEFPPLRHESLVELAIESGGLPGRIVRDVAECDLPALRHLELWLGTDQYGGDAGIDDLAPILAGGRFPSLTYLGLRDSEIVDQLAAAVAGAGVVARLEVLDLSLGMLSDAGALALLAGQPLTHLRRLDLHHHFLSDQMCDRIRDELVSAGVEVDLSDPGDAEDEDRYIAVSE